MLDRGRGDMENPGRAPAAVATPPGPSLALDWTACTALQQSDALLSIYLLCRL
jgi:hypothetical protein